jgi:hypothetical protein
VGDFLAFRRMLTPVLLQLLFWLGVLGCIGAGVLVIVGDGIPPGLPAVVTDRISGIGGDNKLFIGLAILIGGPIALRLAIESVIVVYSINSTLTDIRRSLIKAEQERHGHAPTQTAQSAPIDPGIPRMRR